MATSFRCTQLDWEATLPNLTERSETRPRSARCCFKGWHKRGHGHMLF